MNCRCGTRHEKDDFERLRRVKQLDRDELRDLVVAWPEGAFVDVRACDACGREIARMCYARAR